MSKERDISDVVMGSIVTKLQTDGTTYEQVSVSSGIGRTEGLKFEMPLKW